MVTKVVLIGVGSIGFRHFQSLVNEQKYQMVLFCVDTSDQALLEARKYQEKIKNDLITVRYVKDVESIDKDIDIAIIATSSLVRRKLFESLVRCSNCKYILFEKFLFPKICDYEEVNEILKAKDIRAFVNCCGRLSPGYISLKSELEGAKHLDVVYDGSNWGIGCNAIHIIDEIGFFLNSYDGITVDTLLLDEGLLESKRHGYIEFTGTIICKLGDSAHIVLNSNRIEGIPYRYTIISEDRVITVLPAKSRMYISKNGNNEEKEFIIRYQSELTSQVVEAFIENRDCGLTRYEDTIQWHQALLRAFLNKYNSITGEYSDLCPIT